MPTASIWWSAHSSLTTSAIRATVSGGSSAGVSRRVWTSTSPAESTTPPRILVPPMSTPMVSPTRPYFPGSSVVALPHTSSLSAVSGVERAFAVPDENARNTPASPVARSPTPLDSASANCGSGSRAIAMALHTGQTQHSAEPVANPVALLAAMDTAASAVATRRSASSLGSAIVALHPSLEVPQGGVHDPLLGLAPEHAEHRDRQLDRQRVGHRGRAVAVRLDVVGADLLLLHLRRADQPPLDAAQVLGVLVLQRVLVDQRAGVDGEANLARVAVL